MGHLPDIHPILFGHLGTLVQLGMAGITKRRNPVIMGLDRAALAVPKLVGMGGYHGAISSATELAGAFPHRFQQLFVSVVHLVYLPR